MEETCESCFIIHISKTVVVVNCNGFLHDFYATPPNMVFRSGKLMRLALELRKISFKNLFFVVL